MARPESLHLKSNLAIRRSLVAVGAVAILIAATDNFYFEEKAIGNALGGVSHPTNQEVVAAHAEVTLFDQKVHSAIKSRATLPAVGEAEIQRLKRDLEILDQEAKVTELRGQIYRKRDALQFGGAFGGALSIVVAMYLDLKNRKRI